jgi:hypothetical protein
MLHSLYLYFQLVLFCLFFRAASDAFPEKKEVPKSAPKNQKTGPAVARTSSGVAARGEDRTADSISAPNAGKEAKRAAKDIASGNDLKKMASSAQDGAESRKAAGRPERSARRKGNSSLRKKPPGGATPETAAQGSSDSVTAAGEYRYYSVLCFFYWKRLGCIY